MKIETSINFANIWVKLIAAIISSILVNMFVIVALGLIIRPAYTPMQLLLAILPITLSFWVSFVIMIPLLIVLYGICYKKGRGNGINFVLPIILLTIYVHIILLSAFVFFEKAALRSLIASLLTVAGYLIYHRCYQGTVGLFRKKRLANGVKDFNPQLKVNIPNKYFKIALSIVYAAILSSYAVQFLSTWWLRGAEVMENFQYALNPLEAPFWLYMLLTMPPVALLHLVFTVKPKSSYTKFLLPIIIYSFMGFFYIKLLYPLHHFGILKNMVLALVWSTIAYVLYAIIYYFFATKIFRLPTIKLIS